MRHRTLFLIAIAITFLLVFGVVIHIDIIFIYKSNPDLYLKYLESLPEFDKTGPGCEMPKSPVMPSFYVQNWRPDFFQNCSYEQKNFRWMDEQVDGQINARILWERQCKIMLALDYFCRISCCFPVPDRIAVFEK